MIFFHRMLFGTSKIVTEYLDKGAEYQDIKKIYSVNILYFDLGHGTDYVYNGSTKFIGIHDKDQLTLNAKQQALYNKEFPHELYPEYYLIKVNQFNDVAKNTLDEWIYFLKNEQINPNFTAKGLQQAKEKLDTMKLSPTDRQEYERHMENIRYQRSLVRSNYESGMVDGVKKGEKLGLEKGEKLGLERGEKVGLEKGIKEGITQAARSMVQKLLAKGFPLEEVAKLTDLPLKEISALQKEKS